MKHIAHIGMGFILLALTVVPAVSFAQSPVAEPVITGTATDGGTGSNDPKANGNFQLVSCTPKYDPNNPSVLKNDCTFEQLVATFDRIIKFVLYLVTPIVLGMMLYTGFKYITAGGDAHLIEDAKKMFKPILIGIFFIFAAWLIVYTILDKLLAPSIGGVDKSSIVPAKTN